MTTVGEKLREIRVRRRLTLRELGERTGIAFSTIGGIENGAATTMETLARLGEALGVQVDVRIIDDDGPTLTAEHRAVIDRMTRVLPSQPPGETYVFDAILDAMERRRTTTSKGGGDGRG